MPAEQPFAARIGKTGFMAETQWKIETVRLTDTADTFFRSGPAGPSDEALGW